MQQALVSLADALTYTPQQPIRSLTVMPKEERKMLLHTWNDTTVNYPSLRCLHEIFEAQVVRDRDAIALECAEETLSYAELNARSNRLAHYLIAQSVKPDDRIALCVKRSSKLLVAILGILKAGGAYVPLDPVYSSQRLKNILQNANPLCLLVDSIGRKALGDHEVPMVNLDEALPDTLSAHDNPDPIKLGLTPAHLSSVLYTSGTTGTPKGVMIEHRNITNYLNWCKEEFTTEDLEHTLFSTSIGFDLSVFECFAPLSVGKMIHIVEDALSITQIESKISLFNTVPSALTAILNVGTLPSSLRILQMVGEPLNQRLINRIFMQTQIMKLYNLYGPTETNNVTCYTYKTGDVVIETIGRPIANTRIYLLDSQGEPVPLGAEGELYIGGAGVARGYLNRPELTAEFFLPDPFTGDPEARIYRTGDLARYLSDGNLVFLGRIDHQLKVRGFRIEPGEIEACLVDHPLVREAVVLSWKNKPDADARLVAYVVADPDISMIQNLRTYLATLLPDYMMPAAFVCLSSLPLTANGKLDRHALPTPDDEAFARQSYEIPKGVMEVKLASIWSELLGIERISRHDNFFALGGHSLLIVRMLSQLQKSGLVTKVREVFDAPSLAVLAETLSHHIAISTPPNQIIVESTVITPEMLPLIDLSQAEIDSLVELEPGGVANIQDIYGLAPLQEGILFHHLMAENGDPYLTVSLLQFNDRAALDRYASALDKVIARHDILRTVFVWEGLSAPAQVVLRHVPPLLSDIMLDGPVLEQLNDQFNPRHYRLNLEQAPLLRLVAALTSEGIWIAVQLMHHIIGDHVSLQRLYEEIRTIIDGESDQLAKPIPFRNVVAQARLGVSQAEHTQFFSDMLSDIDTPTLPFGLSDVHCDGNEFNEGYLKISQPLNNRLRALARHFHVSLASLCHLAWAKVLACTSGNESVVFGTVLLGRLQSGEDNDSAIGLLINTLPLRLDINDTTVENAVRNSHSRLSALMMHEHASLALAQRCSGVPAKLSLFNALLNYRHKSQTNRELPAGLRILSNEGRTNYPITLSVDDDDNSLSLSAQVVSPISATRICDYMQQTLFSLALSLARTPQQFVRRLTVMPPEERDMLLHNWNRMTVNYPPVHCLHQLFEAQVACDGSTNAVKCEGETLSYKELNTQSNQLAHYLIGKGVRPDDRVAVCIKRSTKMIVAILGILKAGGAYVPFDPAFSSQRHINILHDASPLYLLADATGQAALGNVQVPVVNLDEALPCGLSIDNPDPTTLGLTPSHLAYIIYTSGSTGTPKGVMIEHKQITRLFEVTRKQFDFDKQDQWCLFHSFSFDFSVWEIWGALLNGSQLAIVSYNTSRSADEFYKWLCINRITVLNQTPSAFKMFIKAKSNSSLSDRLRYVIFGGEELDPFLARDWIEKYSKVHTKLVNMYGITETTVHATYQQLESSKHIYSIGRPLSDLCVYLLDSHGEPVPLGAEGELYIGGACVARGYLNQPELTAERFLLNPFSENTRGRMYRTGDLARYLPDGNLVYLGRADQQVKIRGFRTEPGEIESHLMEHHLVREAVVLPWKYEIDSDTRLVAYVVADPDTSLANNLRTYLVSLLPDYMVPAAYVCLSSLPLTPNGKLDRRALPAPDDEAFARQLYEEPRGEMEEKLAAIWSELLGIERISRNDNFFALGGHSLLIVRVLAQLRKAGLDTSVKQIFDAPTLIALAETLGKHQSFSIPPNLITTKSTMITPDMLPLIDLSQAEIDTMVTQVPGGVNNIQDIYALAPLQEGILYHHLMAQHGNPYLLILRLQFSDRVSLDNYATALQKVIERHDILRTSFFWEGLSEPAQVVLHQVPSILTEVTLDEIDDPELKQSSNRFNLRQYCLDLKQAPLLRLLVSPTSEGLWIGVQLLHHIIGDHVTLQRLHAEVGAIINGESDQLTKPTPFRHVVAQARLGVSQAGHTQFFSDMLSDIDTPTLPFGLSDVHGDGTEFNEGYLKMPQPLNNRLRVLARHFHVSLASLCHLAWAKVLACTSGNESVVFGTVLLGRLQSGEDNDSAIGLLINTLPLRLDINDTTVENAV
ncbi:uncharacterized protein LOC116348125, partial [Contarinia nasturtii]|uniref:uncharacterized protein LOC116348125 n=1 Tax=Contarinia nasturtii TaxID=265458 RepID=UPI0012D3DC42